MAHLQEEQVKYKKYFYALRPLLACKYIEEYHCPPPVFFDELLKLSLPEELKESIYKLLEIKRATEEKDLNPQMPVIHDFIAKELEVQKEQADQMPDDHRKEWDTLNDVFRNVIKSSHSA